MPTPLPPDKAQGGAGFSLPRASARLLLLTLTLPLLAQQPQTNTPHAGYIYPAGAQQGTTLEATIGGQYLNGAKEAYVNGPPGVTVTFRRYARPLTPGEANDLREKMQALLKQPTRTAEENQTIADIRQKLAGFQRRTASPAIAENAILEIRVAPDAVPGPREIRVGANQGITNPIAFTVGRLPELTRAPAKVPPQYNTVNGATPPQRPTPAKPDSPTPITLPVTLNGQMMPAATDRYRFHALKGRHLVVAAAARELIPFISDAVPGWFQAALTLRDASGAELATADHFYFHPDPVLFFDVPQDGDYTLEIHDTIYRGREDFVYRLSVGELPFLTGIFPLGAKTGAKINVEAQGVNLPSPKILQNTKRKPAGTYAISEAGSNALPFAIDTLPEAVAKESADSRRKAQKVKLPLIVEGRIARPGTSEFFRIDGRPGEEIVAEVTARRLQSPLDSVLRLFDSSGNELAVNDDADDRGAGLLTHQADSLLTAKLPAKGAYYLEIADAQRNGGAAYAYRLRISHPQPDFELRVTPSSVNARAGANVPVTVYALRRDGFAGEISLALKDVPPGFALAGAAIPTGQDKIRVTLSIPPNRIDVPLAIKLEGRAEIGGREVRRTAVPAEEMMQAFAWYHLVPESAWMVRALGAQARMNIRAANGNKPIRLPLGGTAPVEVAIPPRFNGTLRVALDNAPEGITIQKVTPGQNSLAVTLKADPEKIQPGTKGNLIIDAFVERPAPAGAARQVRRQPLGTLPAIPFEIVP